MHPAILVGLIVAAVVAGWLVGRRAGQMLPASEERESKPLGTRVRNAATKGLVKLWKWNRKRGKQRDDEDA